MIATFAASDLGNQPLDEAAAGIRIGEHEDGDEQSERQPDQDRDDPADPLQRASHQNACPMPIYNSNESPPGSLFNGTATSSRIGPMGV